MKILAICQCSASREIDKLSYNKNIKKNGKYLCSSCGIKKSYTLDRLQQMSNRSKRLWAMPEFRDKISKYYTPTKRMQFKEAAHKLWQDATHRNNCKFDKSVRTKISIISKARWMNPEYRSKMGKKISEGQSVDEVRKKKRIAMLTHREKSIERQKELWNNPEYRQRMLDLKTNEYKNAISKKMKERWSKPEYRLAMLRGMSIRAKELWKRPEYRQKMSEMSKRLWLSPTYRTKQIRGMITRSKTSKQQLILYSLLDDFKIKYYKDNDNECRIGYYCFDCRIDPQCGVKLINPLFIEVQGTYWHSLPQNIRNDKAKSTYLKTYFPQFDLKYLWEHEFDNKDRIRNLLKYWLGLSSLEFKQFDFCDVVEKIIDYTTAELFISKYHYAGRIGRSGINLGYYLNDELIAIIVYSNPIRQEVALKQGYKYEQVLELSRLAIHPQYQVKNLASHLIGRSVHYIKQNKSTIKCLMSFSDNTYNHHGIIYKASNWTLDGEVAPDYWYVDKDGYVCHKKTLWNKANKNNMAESEYCQKFNYVKIYGNKKLRYKYMIGDKNARCTSN